MILRATIVLLAALNLGAAAWWWLRPAPVDAGVAAADDPVPRLEMADASAPADAAVATTVAPGPPEPPPAAAPEQPAATAVEAPRCLRLGPFADAAARAAARTALQPLATRIAGVERAAAGGSGWRVMLPPQADRAAAQAVVERIRAAGIDDFYIIADGPQANAIALGRYGSEQAARNRQATLQAAGFAAVAEPLGQAAPQLWLDVQLQPQADAAAARRAGPVAALDCAAFGNARAAR